MEEIKKNPVYMATLALRNAAKHGDIEKMESAILLGADINDCYGLSWPHAGRMILTEAIDSRSVEAVRFLLVSGAIVECFAEVPFHLNILEPKVRNFSQISYAIMVNAPIKIIELLIRYSKNLNITTDYYSWTPYKIAAFYKNYKVMALLEKAGADTDASISDKEF
ncbi:MAG: hypothetical protein RQ875_14385 [Vicingaceae bacterium]|nr:hypothetical protein [Vicingaceae bacterium]